MVKEFTRKDVLEALKGMEFQLMQRGAYPCIGAKYTKDSYPKALGEPNLAKPSAAFKQLQTDLGFGVTFNPENDGLYMVIWSLRTTFADLGQKLKAEAEKHGVGDIYESRKALSPGPHASVEEHDGRKAPQRE